MQFYWDLDQCKCVCEASECEDRFTWDTTKCRCVCDGPPADGCADGERYDEGCCECKTCEVEPCNLSE